MTASAATTTSLPRVGPGVIAAGLVVATAAVVGANHVLNRQSLPFLAVVALVAGLAPWVYDAWTGEGPLRPLPAASALPHPEASVRRRLVAIAVVATIANWMWSSDNTFRLPGVVAWILSVGAWVIAWWPATGNQRAGRTSRRPATLATRDVVVWALLLAAVAAGVVYRLYRIDQTPSDPTSDHAEKLLDITDVLHGRHPIFFERNTGREPAQFYFTVVLLRTFGWAATFTNLKIGTALIGALAVPFVYLLAAELAGRVAGLLAATLLAIGTWPVEISRAGLRFPYAMTAAAVTLWLLLRWMRRHDRRDALLCGLAIGVGLYGYSPFRIVVLAVGLGVAIALVVADSSAARRRVIADGLLVAITAAIVFVPLGRYALEHREMFWSRASDRITGGDGGSALAGFLTNNWHAVLGFSWRGDQTWVNAVHSAPMLDVLTGALFLVGLAALITHVVRRRDPRAAFLVLALPVLALTATLAIAFPIEVPSVNREGVLAPVVFTVAALPLAVLVRRLRQALGRWRGDLVGAALLATAVAIVAVLSFHQYFDTFDRQERKLLANTTEIAGAIRGAAVVGVAPDDAYVVDWPYWLDIRNIAIELGDVTWGDRHQVSIDAPLPAPPATRPLLLIVNVDDEARLAEVARAYPNAHVTTIADSPRPFVVVWVPATAPS